MTASAVHLADRGVLAISGIEARDFLQNIITNNTSKIKLNHAIYAALLTPQGKYLFDFFIAEQEGRLLVDCEASRKDDLLRRLMMYRLRSKADIIDVSDQMVVWAGPWPAPKQLPDATDLSQAGSAAAFGDGVLFADSRSHAMGWRAILPKDSDLLVDSGPEGRNSYEERRITLGLPDSSRDMEPDKTLALEGCLDELNGVDFTKGCYVGQELTARTKHRGKVRRRLLPVTIDGGAPVSGTDILKDGKTIGSVRTGHNEHAIALLRVEDIDGSPLSADGKVVHVTLPKWLDES